MELPLPKSEAMPQYFFRKTDTSMEVVKVTAYNLQVVASASRAKDLEGNDIYTYAITRQRLDGRDWFLLKSFWKGCQADAFLEVVQAIAKKIRQAIDALQALCPHEKSAWVGNDHNHNYYRCTNCKIILEK